VGMCIWILVTQKGVKWLVVVNMLMKVSVL